MLSVIVPKNITSKKNAIGKNSIDDATRVNIQYFILYPVRSTVKFFYHAYLFEFSTANI
jgi:hypothetical protein